MLIEGYSNDNHLVKVVVNNITNEKKIKQSTNKSRKSKN